MRCRVGDLAVIVCDEQPQKDVGKFVHVREATWSDDYGDPCWICDSAGDKLRYWAETRWRYAKKGICIPDAWLRPIRDPGDDATDEMVLISGKPQEVTA